MLLSSDFNIDQEMQHRAMGTTSWSERTMSQQHAKSAEIPVALSPELLASAKTTVSTAISTTFVTDTLLGPGLSHAMSAISSTVKRHGSLIERSIVDALERSNQYIVLRNVAMPITTAAERLVAGNSPADLPACRCPATASIATLRSST
jgi:hypothetical protein